MGNHEKFSIFLVVEIEISLTILIDVYATWYTIVKTVTFATKETDGQARFFPKK